jgi:hypothetical protein
MVEFTLNEPVKLGDGRYFAKIVTPDSPLYVTVFKAEIIDSSNDDIRIKIPPNSIQGWDDKIITEAVKNSVTWFKKEITQEVLATYYQSSVDADILEAEPVLNSKGIPSIAYFDMNKELISGVENNTTCNILLQLDGIWFLRKSFGPVWRLVQVKVRKTIDTVKCLLGDDDE